GGIVEADLRRILLRLVHRIRGVLVRFGVVLDVSHGSSSARHGQASLGSGRVTRRPAPAWSMSRLGPCRASPILRFWFPSATGLVTVDAPPAQTRCPGHAFGSVAGQHTTSRVPFRGTGRCESTRDVTSAKTHQSPAPPGPGSGSHPLHLHS